MLVQSDIHEWYQAVAARRHGAYTLYPLFGNPNTGSPPLKTVPMISSSEIEQDIAVCWLMPCSSDHFKMTREASDLPFIDAPSLKFLEELIGKSSANRSRR